MTNHKETQGLAWITMRKRGYTVRDVELTRRHVIETKEGNPDLIATRDGETLIIEVKGDNESFVRQIEGYAKLEGKTILLLGIDTSNIELWGIQDLDYHLEARE